MKLSIVTINYNNAAGLEKTLKSVACQHIPEDFELEHIIVDGNSTDESVRIIRNYEQQLSSSSISLTWVSEPDNGIYNAMNKGIEIACGVRQADVYHCSKSVEDRCTKPQDKSKEERHYIQILNSGDCMYSDTVIVDMAVALDKSHYPGIMYGNMIRDYDVNAKRRKQEVKDMCLSEQHEWTMYDFIRGTINHDPTWINRKLYEKYGLYREDLPITADWRWFVETVALHGEKPIYVPIDVTLFDTTGISETQIEHREQEREAELKRILPESVLADYRNYHFPIEQINRLKRHHLWGIVYLMERTLFKLEKWKILKR
ncbi:MAG: glycosyltransferase [Paludibacteraceae bacterium]